MRKIRVIDQRYGTDPQHFEVDGQGNKISTYDRPLWNHSTGRPLKNGGCLARVDKENPDPKKRQMRQYFPGETLEVPDEEAAQLVRDNPLVVEFLVEDYDARVKRIAERDRRPAGAEGELASFMTMSGAEEEAALRIKRLAEEKRVRDLMAAGVPLHPVVDKDLVGRLEAMIQAQQAQIDALTKAQAKP